MFDDTLARVIETVPTALEVNVSLSVPRGNIVLVNVCVVVVEGVGVEGEVVVSFPQADARAKMHTSAKGRTNRITRTAGRALPSR
jgi:hypothetical protein